MVARTINRPIVVVADYRQEHAEINSATDDLDIYTNAELDEILCALRMVCKTVSVFSSPVEFIDSIQNFRGALVFPLWSGKLSRNRTALVSAISEGYGLEFFGADTYAYIVGQDKSLAKQVARDFGISTPSSVLIHSLDRLHLIDLLTPPIVVKPSLEGSSIGISTRNLCRTTAEAYSVTTELLNRFAQPVLVETFVPGIETTVTIFGLNGRIHLFQALEIYEPTGQVDYSSTIWSYELKKANDRLPIVQRPICLPAADEKRLQDLFLALGKIDLVRIDGRVRDGVFHFLEMNPEPYLAQFSSVARSFEYNGFSYEEMFRQLLLPFEVQPQRDAPVCEKEVVKRQLE